MFKRVIFIYLKEWQIGRKEQEEKENFHSLAHSPNGHSGEGCASLKTGAERFICVSHMAQGNKQHLDHLLLLSQARYQEAASEVE